MGTDIRTIIEIKKDGIWQPYLEDRFEDVKFEEAPTEEDPQGFNKIIIHRPEPFYWQSYSMFALFAGVRNISDIQPLAVPKGLPSEATIKSRKELKNWEVVTWFSLKELSAINPLKMVEDKRVAMRISSNFVDCGMTVDKGIKRTYNEFLGEFFFTNIQILKDIASENNLNDEELRVVMGFAD